MTDDTAKFVLALNSEVMDRAGGLDGTAADFKENVFTEIVLEHLADLGVVENAECVFFEGKAGRGSGKVNGYAVSEDLGAIDLFVSVFLNAAELARVPAEDIRKAVEQAVRYFDAALKGLHKSLQPGTEGFGMTHRLSELGPRTERVRIFVLTDGLTSLGKDKLPDRSIGGVQVRFEVWDAERLSRATMSGRSQEPIDIQVSDFHNGVIRCVQLPEVVVEYAAWVAILPGDFIFRIYDRYSARLLERNVRSFLQAKGKVNRGIRDTIRREPSRFMAYNNGISITAEEVEVAREAGGDMILKRVCGMQIVNGGQTTASIHRAAKVDKADLNQVFLQAKITVIPSALIETLAPRIAEFANTQNPVQMADFSANDPFHIAIERLSKSLWIPGEQGKWFYERARGQYMVAQAMEGSTAAQLRLFKERTPPARRFAKIDLAKWLTTWDQLPHLVSAGAQKNFVMFSQRQREARANNWEPDEVFYRELIAKGILFNAVTEIVRRERFEGYRPQIVAYTLAYLALRSGGQLDLTHIWQHQRLSTGLEELLRMWSHPIAENLIREAGAKDVKEWTKKSECWAVIRALDLALPDHLPPEFARTVQQVGGWGIQPTSVLAALDPDELDALATCRRTDATDWVKIIEWGRNSGRVDQRQRQIATQLASLAANGWVKDPSVKDAKEGRRIVNAANEQGVLERPSAPAQASTDLECHSDEPNDGA
jgi:hypothetical protein